MKVTRDSVKQLFKKINKRVDSVFLLSVILLSLYGTVMVFTSGYAYASFRYGDALHFIKRQTIWLLLGFSAMYLASNVQIDIIKRLTPIMYAGTLVLLALTLLIGFVGNGAQRWIAIGPITIQPSEIAKLTMVMMLALYFDKNDKKACQGKTKKEIFIYGTLIPGLIIGVPIILVMLQHHLSCVIILGTIGLLVIISAGVNLRYIGGAVGGGAVGVTCLAFFTDYTKDRITVWRDPEKYKLTGGWQTLQGLMAIGSGGIFGKGLGKGELKYCYVSEPANDMIFAILCEELGLVGAISAICLFMLLVYRGFKISLNCDDTYSRLLGIGISVKIAVQVLLNIAVVTNTIPNTGISLPFFSYGGTSLLMIFLEMGIILSMSKSAKRR